MTVLDAPIFAINIPYVLCMLRRSFPLFLFFLLGSNWPTLLFLCVFIIFPNWSLSTASICRVPSLMTSFVLSSWERPKNEFMGCSLSAMASTWLAQNGILFKLIFRKTLENSIIWMVLASTCKNDICANAIIVFQLRCPFSMIASCTLGHISKEASRSLIIEMTMVYLETGKLEGPCAKQGRLSQWRPTSHGRLLLTSLGEEVWGALESRLGGWVKEIER